MPRAKLPAARSLRPKRKPASTKRARRPSTRTPRHEPDNRQLQDMVASRGMRLVPIDSVTDVEQIEHRLDILATEATAAFTASKASAEAQKVLGDQIYPLLTEIKAALGDVTGRVSYLERAKTAHAESIVSLERAVGSCGTQIISQGTQITGIHERLAIVEDLTRKG